MKNKELIMCIVNSGFAGEAIAAAKKAGAPGGVIINGRGTADQSAEALYHIAFHLEKDIIMIVVDEDIRDDCLHALYKRVGTGTDAMGVVFTLPVDRAVGLAGEEEDEDEE